MAKIGGYHITSVAQDTTFGGFGEVDELITQLDLSNVKTSKASFIVVITQGEGDEKALTEALQKDCAYLGFVASRKKMAAIKEYLEDIGIDKKKTEPIVPPAGIDPNAKKTRGSRYQYPRTNYSNTKRHIYPIISKI